MPTDRQLKWVLENRQRGQRIQSIGQLAHTALRSSSFRSSEIRGKIGKVLEEVLGSSLASHCVVGDLAGGVLAIYVDDASFLYHLRADAQPRLLQALAAQKGSQRVREIRFLLHVPDG